MSGDQPARADLAQRRRDARHLVEHLRFLEDNVVGPALVKDALLSGLSQSETAKLLGMSKRTVNQNARRPYMEYATVRDERAAERRSLSSAFLSYVWGSEDAARAAIERSVQYDRERLLIETE
ncbi:hypothetical protein [Prescottella equi]|uniref:hypothetical protein n=1 Tax=Rhodococcus hoagii TaxID=43767 RepID=UPI000D0E5CAA|nr:hypothetical protein [Prescottella equi]AVP71421.1 hypothetical protein C7H75_25420 [Prescottella equi]MCD7052772.1 hypothetical protein [Rhodococcus sp. BH2-1]